MKNYLKNLGLIASVCLEIVGILIFLMQYKILSQDAVVLISSIFIGILIPFSIVTFFTTIIHNKSENKQPAHSHQIEFSVITFWVLLICSLVMMIITNVLAFAGFNYDTAAILCSGAIWFICALIPSLMFLLDIVVLDEDKRRNS